MITYHDKCPFVTGKINADYQRNVKNLPDLTLSVYAFATSTLSARSLVNANCPLNDDSMISSSNVRIGFGKMKRLFVDCNSIFWSSTTVIVLLAALCQEDLSWPTFSSN